MKISSPEAVKFDAPINPELPASVSGSRELTPDQEQMLADMRAADPTIGVIEAASTEIPESPASGDGEVDSSADITFNMLTPAEIARMNESLIAFGSTPVAEVVEVADLSPVAVAGTDQLEALANDPAQHSNEDGTITTEFSPRKLTEEELAVINTNLENFSAPQAEVVPEPVIEDEKPISGRRILDTKNPVAENADNQALIDQLTAGKLSNVGTRLKGVRDLRADRKEIISKQRESMKETISDARGDMWNARGRRVANWKENNVVKRVGQRSNRRAELRDMAFDAIDGTNATNPRKALMRLQARKNAWKIARTEVKDRTTKLFEQAEKDVLDAKGKLRTQKGRGRQVRYSPVRRRTTLGGAGSAGLYESWKDSGAEMRKTEEQRARDRAKRLAELKKRQQKSKAPAKK